MYSKMVLLLLINVRILLYHYEAFQILKSNWYKAPFLPREKLYDSLEGTTWLSADSHDLLQTGVAHYVRYTQ